jgi:hypothetical protein
MPSRSCQVLDGNGKRGCGNGAGIAMIPVGERASETTKKERPVDQHAGLHCAPKNVAPGLGFRWMSAMRIESVLPGA